MKYKYYLRGFGIGVLFATFILMIAITISDKAPKKSTENVTNSNLMKNDKETKSDNEEVKQESKDIESSENIENIETTENTDITESKETSTDNKNKSEDSGVDTGVKNDEDETTSDLQEMINFTIQGGMTSYEVAMMLEELGIIDNAKAFDDYMQELGYTAKLRIGEYNMAKGSSYQVVAEMIT